MIKKFDKFDKVNENSISAYNAVWVIHKYGDTDINEVFLKKDEAELECIKRCEEFEKNFKTKSNYKVKSLSDAIDDIIDYVKNESEINFRDRENY